MTRFSKKMAEENQGMNQGMKLIGKSREIHTIHTPARTSYIWRVPTRREKKYSIYKAQWQVARTGLDQ
jgi:hypothetical protein